MPTTLKMGFTESIQNINYFALNPDGVLKVRFKTSAQADWCVQKMDGRYFALRKLICLFWDGKTDYRIVRETNEEVENRVSEFGKWLEQQN